MLGGSCVYGGIGRSAACSGMISLDVLMVLGLMAFCIGVCGAG